MTKFNSTKIATRAATSPVVTGAVPDAVTFEGGPGFSRGLKGELFLLASNAFGAGEDTFYESGRSRDARFSELVRRAAVDFPEWTAGFLGWLRGPGNMRTTPVMGAADAAHAMLAAGIPGSRAVVASVLQRADEPGELIAYWRATYGPLLPKPVKAGINDALRGGLWTQYAVHKYDTVGRAALRFGDILSLTRPVPQTAEQEALWRFALLRAGTSRGRDYTFGAPYERARRFSERTDPMSLLPMVAFRAELAERIETLGVEGLCDPVWLRGSGYTHEDILSMAGNLPGADTLRARLWEALIPTMGYMALLRNLRAFDEAGVGDDAAKTVAERLADPDRVARSRQFPFRFLSAHQETTSLRWGPALESALNASLGNIPVLPGRTLVLADTSGSMKTSISPKSKMSAQRIAAVFAVAIALRNPGAVDLYGFADGNPFEHPVPRGASLLRTVDAFNARNGEDGHGTDIAGSVRATYRGHDRVIVLSDMQTSSHGLHPGGGLVPDPVWVYGFNVAGYKYGAMPSGHGRWHEFGGLTDATFPLIPMLEGAGRAEWPWETAPSAS